MAVSFIGGGNRRTQRKPLTCHKSLTNFIFDTNDVCVNTEEFKKINKDVN
jgi:hypothetical protein